MAMEFKRKLPIPMEIREEMPLSAELTAKKQAFDAEVAKVFTGEDARKVLIIGPCSADREDSVLIHEPTGQDRRGGQGQAHHHSARLHQ